MELTLAKKIPKRLLLAHVIGGGLFLLIQCLPLAVPNIRLQYFAQPAARVAADFMGIPLHLGTDSISLSHPTIDVAVTEACSGFDFFALLVALLVGAVIFRQEKRHLIRDALFVLASAYSLTIFANTSRIVCAVQIRATTADLIPSFFNSIIHQTIGVIIFVTLLALSWTFLTKFYERKTEN